jgi:hypothetical protein
MIVVAWSLARQVKVRPIPADFVDVILDLEAETVLFNEYVDGSDETSSLIPSGSACRTR